MTAILRRFIEYTAIEILLSVIFSLLFNFKIIPSYMIAVVAVCGVFFIGYAIVQVLLLRYCCYMLADMNRYFLFNMLAYVTFIIISALCLWLMPSELFTYLFGITKLFRYIGFKVSAKVSLLIFHFIMVLLIFLSPIHMPPPLMVIPVDKQPLTQTKTQNKH